MTLHQSSPRKGDKPRREHWTYTGTPNGTTWHAYIAGPCLWLDCHTKGRTKPCVRCVTNGEVPCHVCNAFNEPVETGYQPLYRECDGKPVVVIVHEYSRDIISSLKFHARVVVGRGRVQSDPLFIQRSMNQEPRYTTTIPHRLRPADPTESLLTTWKLPELTAWYYSKKTRSDNAVSLPEPDPGPLAITPPPAAPLEVKGPMDKYHDAEERAKKEAADEELKIGGTMDYLLGRARNGKPPFKKK